MTVTEAITAFGTEPEIPCTVFHEYKTIRGMDSTPTANKAFVWETVRENMETASRITEPAKGNSLSPEAKMFANK